MKIKPKRIVAILEFLYMTYNDPNRTRKWISLGTLFEKGSKLLFVSGPAIAIEEIDFILDQKYAEYATKGGDKIQITPVGVAYLGQQGSNFLASQKSQPQ